VIGQGAGEWEGVLGQGAVVIRQACWIKDLLCAGKHSGLGPCCEQEYILGPAMLDWCPDPSRKTCWVKALP
jgi:hypothetical protein